MKSGNYFEINAPKIYLLAQHPPKNDKTSFTIFFRTRLLRHVWLIRFRDLFFFLLLPRSGGVPLRWRPFLFLPSKKRKVSSLLYLSLFCIDIQFDLVL